jgi:hypothetical protein
MRVELTRIPDERFADYRPFVANAIAQLILHRETKRSRIRGRSGG